MKLHFALALALALASPQVAAAASTTSTLVPCGVLPSGTLSEDDLARLIPAGSPGSVRIAWKTETQEDTFGFNILRADSEAGPYRPLNKEVIRGEGTTNIAKAYCFEDTRLERGTVYYYQIEEVTNSGEKTIVGATAATRVKVKTVQEERDWLKKRAAASAADNSAAKSASK